MPEGIDALTDIEGVLLHRLVHVSGGGGGGAASGVLNCWCAGAARQRREQQMGVVWVVPWFSVSLGPERAELSNRN